MSKAEFRNQTPADVQNNYFLGSLPRERRGSYHFKRGGLSADPGTLVLFQYDNHVIASALFESQEWFDNPEDEYRGALHFDVQSIEVFDPLGPDEIRAIWPDEFERFSRAKQTLSAKRYEAFVSQVKNPRSFQSESEKACDIEEPKARRGESTVSRIIRDTKQSNKVKQSHNYKCQIRGCGNYVEYGEGLRYVEAHHVRPLGEPHGGPDVPANILCLCPNHHAACDLGAIKLNLKDLQSVPGHKIDPEFLKYHNRVIYRRARK